MIDPELGVIVIDLALEMQIEIGVSVGTIDFTIGTRIVVLVIGVSFRIEMEIGEAVDLVEEPIEMKEMEASVDQREERIRHRKDVS